MFNLLMVTIGIVFVLTQGALAWFVWQAARNPRALYWHENRRLETTWTVVTAVVLTAFIVMGYQIWLSLHAPTAAAAEKTAVVEVWGQQFFWTARYPGPDGQFGKTDPQYVDFQKNPFGIDPNDPAGRDDIVVDGSKEPIVVPAGYRVTVRLASRDVIHSFFVPSPGEDGRGARPGQRGLRRADGARYLRDRVRGAVWRRALRNARRAPGGLRGGLAGLAPGARG